ncbi:hypothetical protein H1191_02530 [Paenactinomyces guangxiensis]|uniref:Uncharacterized protein n=1 Tax=Paenactinomyces guangxiensis TaxID=1490290 RepID=A0A7W2A751_9BACL|nr:hypothetical protein [Paenactinomyces guangxiensis]MBH8589960.1 hypothetical protein [Paenactinomyces guangxiensis]
MLEQRKSAYKYHGIALTSHRASFRQKRMSGV